MGEEKREASGVLVIAVTVERSAPSTFRARLTGTVGPSKTVSVASTPEQVCDAVLTWLGSLNTI